MILCHYKETSVNAKNLVYIAFFLYIQEIE